MKKIKVGVVGTGVMGEFHTKILADPSMQTIVSFQGIYDANLSRGQAIADLAKTQCFASLADIQKACDALILASPTSTHFEIAQKCLEDRKHLLIEKPLAQTAEQAEKLVELAKKKKCVLAVGMIERFNPAFQKAQARIKKEPLLGIVAERYSPLPARITDADVIDDMMVHDLDLVCQLARSEVESLKASAQKVETKKFDKANATLYFKNGLIAMVHASRVHKSKVRKLTITTTQAMYEVDLLAKKLYRRDFEHLTDKAEVEVPVVNSLQLEDKDFIMAVGKEREPLTPGEDGLKILRLIELIRANVI